MRQIPSDTNGRDRLWFDEIGSPARRKALGRLAGVYWVGEAMGDADFRDLKLTPRMVSKTAKMVAANAAHLACPLKVTPYPG